MNEYAFHNKSFVLIRFEIFFLPNLYNTVLLIFDRKLQTLSFPLLWHFIDIIKNCNKAIAFKIR